MKNAVALCLMTCALATRLSAQITLQSQVLSVYPPQNATSVPVHDSLVVQFGVNVLPQSLSDTTFVIEAQQSGWHRGTVQYDPQTRTLTFKPVKLFFVGELVTAVATKSIQYDSAGVVKNIRGFAWQFWGKVTAKSYGTMRENRALDFAGKNMFDVETVSDLNADGRNDITVFSGDSARVFYNLGEGSSFSELSLPNRGNMFSFNYAWGQYQDIFAGGCSFFRNLDGEHFAIGTVQNSGFTTPFPISFDATASGSPCMFGSGTGDTMLLMVVRDSVVTEIRKTPLPSEPFWCTAFDANNDGTLDVAVGTTAGIMLLMNDGEGNFAPPVLIAPLGSGNIQSGDVTGDGWSDLLIVSTGGMDVLKNNHDGTFTRDTVATGHPRGFGLSYGLTIGDLDGSGTLDAAFTLGSVIGGKDTIYVLNLLNDGTGSFHVVQTWRGNGGGGSQDESYLKCADISGDGALDLIVSHTSAERILLLHNDSTVKVGVEAHNQEQPQAITLDDVHPDPVTQTATIVFSLPNTQNVHVAVYNADGENVNELLAGSTTEGGHTLSFDCGMLPSGVYFVRLTSGQVVLTQPFTVTH